MSFVRNAEVTRHKLELGLQIRSRTTNTWQALCGRNGDIPANFFQHLSCEKLIWLHLLVYFQSQDQSLCLVVSSGTYFRLSRGSVLMLFFFFELLCRLEAESVSDVSELHTNSEDGSNCRWKLFQGYPHPLDAKAQKQCQHYLQTHLYRHSTATLSCIKITDSVAWVWASYTDRATATCRRSYCQLLRIEGATWSAWRIPTAVFSAF
jgi:hypothetical protein